MNQALLDTPLHQEYTRLCDQKSDIYLHLPTLMTLSSRCERVVEFGCRLGDSTVALAQGNPALLTTYDINEKHTEGVLTRIQPLLTAGRPDQRTLFQVDVRDTADPTLDIGWCDLLFIDSLHIYEQLRDEFKVHSPRVQKFIACHDTVNFGERGEYGDEPGLAWAVWEFVRDSGGVWRYERHDHRCNGLTVLERVK